MQSFLEKIINNPATNLATKKQYIQKIFASITSNDTKLNFILNTISFILSLSKVNNTLI